MEQILSSVKSLLYNLYAPVQGVFNSITMDQWVAGGIGTLLTLVVVGILERIQRRPEAKRMSRKGRMRHLRMKSAIAYDLALEKMIGGTDGLTPSEANRLLQDFGKAFNIKHIIASKYSVPPKAWQLKADIKIRLNDQRELYKPVPLPDAQVLPKSGTLSSQLRKKAAVM